MNPKPRVGLFSALPPTQQLPMIALTFCCLLLFLLVPAAGQGITYPDLQGVSKPNPEPTLPVQMDTFAPPVDSSTPSVSAPAFAEWTRSGKPNDTLVATGSQFTNYSGADAGKDSEFLMYGQTTSGNGVLADASVQRLDGSAQKAALTLSTNLPAWSTYFLWPKNSNGYGYPVAVNRTDAWWLGPSTAAAGATVSVYGRNLSYQNGTTTSWIYIKPAGEAGQWVTPTSVNPYQVSFTVPSLANGSYEVWIHNGHGGHYGWSGPFALTVNGGPGWTSTRTTSKITAPWATASPMTRRPSKLPFKPPPPTRTPRCISRPALI